jgi:hypothetical protein
MSTSSSGLIRISCISRPQPSPVRHRQDCGPRGKAVTSPLTDDWPQRPLASDLGQAACGRGVIPGNGEGRHEGHPYGRSRRILCRSGHHGTGDAHVGAARALMLLEERNEPHQNHNAILGSSIKDAIRSRRASFQRLLLHTHWNEPLARQPLTGRHTMILCDPGFNRCDHYWVIAGAGGPEAAAPILLREPRLVEMRTSHVAGSARRRAEQAAAKRFCAKGVGLRRTDIPYAAVVSGTWQGPASALNVRQADRQWSSLCDRAAARTDAAG